MNKVVGLRSEEVIRDLIHSFDDDMELKLTICIILKLIRLLWAGLRDVTPKRSSRTLSIVLVVREMEL